MVRTVLKILVLDVILLLAEFEIVQDVQNRIQCALGSPLYGQVCVTRSSPSFSYSLLTRSFSMVVGGNSVQSPPTLDWVQLIAYVLVAVNVWFVYTTLAKRRSLETAQGSAQTPVPSE
ncbi:MAG TPA: hypothetical protein VEJ19_00640 [Nitrososphaerales archaeon]|nr:hypothetical protein [Nitrososphaerales archaeon]